MKLRKGLTLAEILVVIFILTLFIAIPFWGGQRWIVRNRLRQEAVKIKALIENERTNAMATNAMRAIVFNGRDVTIMAEDLNAPRPNLNLQVANYPNYFSQNITFGGLGNATALDGGNIEEDGISFDDNTVIFTPFGLCQNPGEIYLNNGRELMALQVNAFGMVRIFSWRGNTWYEEKQ